MKKATLCYLVKEEEAEEGAKKRFVCLGLKLRDFGKGKYNGAGGKALPGETLEKCVMREAEQELHVRIIKMHKVAECTFYDPPVKGKDNDFQVTAFIVTEWEGEPRESDEVRPKWFPIDELPFDKMWSNDPFWVPQVLAGKKVRAHFRFDEDENIIEQHVEEVDSLDEEPAISKAG